MEFFWGKSEAWVSNWQVIRSDYWSACLPRKIPSRQNSMVAANSRCQPKSSYRGESHGGAAHHFDFISRLSASPTLALAARETDITAIFSLLAFVSTSFTTCMTSSMR